ncbi:hypothetical protein OOK29_25905 [Streptomyces phaeochromogenes]|uniref:hypothetical protein n=1 Tax=Streptomyces phaeochromogenes TaxID=1923 RepID=UPI0022593043|nr:hypothetical protein [Streptomyces phaeochromogenes]MCX5601589.1 hypothetical protein [Streptomyces phaeochromogenes]
MIRPTTHEDLQTIIDAWDDLADLVEAPIFTTWPPPGTIPAYNRALDDAELRAVRAERAEYLVAGDDAPGTRPVPINLRAVDIQIHVTSELLELADQLAASVQRPPVQAESRKGWTDTIHRETLLLAAKDAAHPARWHFDGREPANREHPQRTAVMAATWLQHRLTNPGPAEPFRPLTVAQHDAVSTTAHSCVRMIDDFLGIHRRSVPIPGLLCPAPCRGPLVMFGGDGDASTVRCRRCGRSWTDTTHTLTDEQLADGTP